MKKYILGIDQSTQGTKAALFDQSGQMKYKAECPHEQKINEKGWVSHDPEEIYRNVLRVVKEVMEEAEIDGKAIAAMGISNQRETTILWDENGKPLQDAVVWQCSRAQEITDAMSEYEERIREKTGLPLSPYFPAAKMIWLLHNSGMLSTHGLHLGTMDSFLLYRLTGGKVFATDYSNASRTQLFNIHTLTWDEELCTWFGIPEEMLPEVCNSNACFGYTDMEGIFSEPIPIHAVMGDSHAALFGHGCLERGMVKVTYGTGSSIMMNTGSQIKQSSHGLAASLAWGIDGKITYVLEGNINYTGAVVTWLKDEVGLITSPSETQKLAEQADREDKTVLVPAFSGLSAPYWKSDAKALLYGMSRITGRAEIVRAALESIAYQIADVLSAMEEDGGSPVREISTDGGASANRYLMQFQSDLTGIVVHASARKEISVTGAAYLAGLSTGFYQIDTLFREKRNTDFYPEMDLQQREEKRKLWNQALNLVLNGNKNK